MLSKIVQDMESSSKSPIIWCEIGWCHENYQLPYNL
jgi:hypothetical protein